MADKKVDGHTRRQVLRKGLVVGGVAWAAPTITAISLTPANAAAPSGRPPKEPPGKPPKQQTPPPPNETPSASPTPKDTPKPTPKPPRPSDSPTPGAKPGSNGGDTELPDTGAGDVATPLALGSAAALSGSVLYAAARKLKDTSQDRPTPA